MPPPRSLREIHSGVEVRRRVDRLAAALAADLGPSRPVFLAIAEGARRSTEALVEALARRGVRPDVQSVRARRTRGTALREISVEPFDEGALLGRDVLVLDDVADEGRTLEAVLALVREAKPRTLRVAVLVSKRARRRVDLPLDYVGFEIPDGWVVGFGMDLDGKYRELDALAVVDGERVDQEDG
jgi:hypoxanthine phosphoribosyltransferase